MKSSYLVPNLPETANVSERGRVPVLRELAGDLLCQGREGEIDAQYERAYAGVEHPLGEEFDGWEDEGASPDAE